jgi:hypothetical protein
VPSAVIDVPSKSHVVSIERERLELDVAAAERRVDRECVSGLTRIKPEIVAVQLDEVEGVQEYLSLARCDGRDRTRQRRC